MKKREWIIVSLITIGSILAMMAVVGNEEYKQTFCEGKLGELNEDETAGLLVDYTGGIVEYDCCKIPRNVNGISRSKNCIRVDDYVTVPIPKKISYFLKKFK